MQPAPGDTVELVPGRLRELFFHDCDDETFAAAELRNARQSRAAFVQAAREIAWRTVPSTYVVCTEDRAIPADAQRRFALPATRTVEIPTGHHPFLSHPHVLAAVIAEAARSTRR